MRRRQRMILVLVSAVAVLVSALVSVQGSPNPAGAFGSVDISLLGQRAVHEPITRTLGCSADAPVTNCLEPISLGVLAGHDGTFGAVGEPDDPLDGFPNPSARHCDNVDYGYTSYQTIEEAQVSFDNCLDWFQSYMDFAVSSAAGLLRTDGTIDAAATDLINATGGTYNSCSFPDPKKGNTSKDSAKCNVLNGFGRALHVYEDVWSHSNWGDDYDLSKDVSLTNPIGLANTEQPAFMAYPGPRSVPIPVNFITGCDDSVSKGDCMQQKSYDEPVSGFRTGHSVLNKDNGTVSPTSCVATDPVTSRGKVTTRDGVTNFSRAVTGACGAARRAWSDLQNAITARYGSTAAQSIIRAISKDHPLTDCMVSGTAAKADGPPMGDRDSARSVTLVLVNTTRSTIRCGFAVLDGGEWASYPSDSIAAGATGRWRTQSNGFATGTEGSATMFVDATGTVATVRWNNPYWGSNDYGCDVTGALRCATSGGSGNDSTLTITISEG